MEKNLIKPLLGKNDDQWSWKKFFILLILAVFFGGGGGYFLRSFFPKKTTGQKIISAKTEGIVDKKTFRDQAEGVLREGGIDGEGTFHLERPGGQSQNVYLTSSTVDLSKYIGKKVRVYGKTFAAEKAGWLMDVGFIEIIK